MLFVPRQVALAAAAAAATMVKEESKKEKKSKNKIKSKAAKGSSSSAAAVAAVAAFLESSGFPRTLAALQSEANLEADSWRSSPVSLEDLVSKFIDSSNSAPGDGAARIIDQAGVVVEDAGKKKKKKGGDTELSEAKNKENVPSAPQEEESKEKNKKKKKKDSTEAVESESKAAEPSAAGKPSENADVETKAKKKKKGKSTPETSDKIATGTIAAGADDAKGKCDALETDRDGNEKKTKKKQKKSKENVQLVENKEVAGKDSVPESNNENKSGMEVDKGESGMPPADNAAVGKKRKLEQIEGSNPPSKEDSTANQKLSKGSSEDDNKPNKRQKKSSEVCYTLYLPFIYVISCFKYTLFPLNL
ncbi:hypothetical protein GUJ93_ZPchr0009g1358 [Zizania palustris]|uniref:LisH domain-containing protein n=1 Tax=Zizania palustris TaxID=103762 RepID=A0A8J5RRR9_ZIZPA|nr:hypothetical protein GUJ93_ZPchr0009g1358 [Zizania palustris]KAG8049256.1 hypothetical protein GUJ93_ZPchr0009g1358 [Zizania palustris]